MIFCKKVHEPKDARLNMINRVISEFPEIFDEFNPSFYNDGSRFQGKIVHESPSYGLNVIVIDSYSNLVQSCYFEITPYLKYHKLHFTVCQAVINCIKELEERIKEKFMELMEKMK